MANLSPEREQEIRDNIKKYGTAVHNANGWAVPGDKRAKAYNAIHGTNIVNDKALDIVLDNERELERSLTIRGYEYKLLKVLEEV